MLRLGIFIGLAVAVLLATKPRPRPKPMIVPSDHDPLAGFSDRPPEPTPVRRIQVLPSAPNEPRLIFIKMRLRPVGESPQSHRSAV